MRKFTNYVAALFVSGVAFSAANAEELALEFSMPEAGVVRASLNIENGAIESAGAEDGSVVAYVENNHYVKINVPFVTHVKINSEESYIDFDLNELGIVPNETFTLVVPEGYVYLFDNDSLDNDGVNKEQKYNFVFNGIQNPTATVQTTAVYNLDRLSEGIITITWDRYEYILPGLTSGEGHYLYFTDGINPRVTLYYDKNVMVSEDNKSLILILEGLKLDEGNEYVIHIPECYVELTNDYETFDYNSLSTGNFTFMPLSEIPATIVGTPMPGDTSISVTWEHKTLTPNRMSNLEIFSTPFSPTIMSSENGVDDILQISGFVLNEDVYILSIPKAVVNIDGAGNMAQAITFAVTNETDSVEELKAAIAEDDVIYNLNGVRVDKDKLTKGIFIINGRKVTVK